MPPKTLTIGGIPVTFPYDPYPSQMRYMETVITALKKGEHALLESPTGTGKTLCLLCATLGFHSAVRAKVQLSMARSNSANYDAYTDNVPILGTNTSTGTSLNLGPNTIPIQPIIDPTTNTDALEPAWASTLSNISLTKVPLIIYASRTHSQLSQVISELRKTIYRPKIAIVTSREQLCVKTEVQSLRSNTAMTAVCSKLVKKAQCQYHENTSEAISRLELERQVDTKRLFDIEDLTKFARAHSACPYFVGRNELTQAELVFMPYNYLIDKKTQGTISGLDLNQAIIIMDEAHNIEGSCGEARSTDISSADLTMALSECRLVRKFQQQGMFIETTTTSHLDQVETILDQCLDNLMRLPLDQNNRFSRPGSFILEFLIGANIHEDNARAMTSLLENVGRAYVEGIYAKREKNVCSALQSISSAFRTIFGIATIGSDEDDNLDQKNVKPGSKCLSRSSSTNPNYNYFRVFVEEVTGRPIQGKISNKLTQPTNTPKIRTLSYWCFYPGVAMGELLNKGIYSLLLTSGTMSPLRSFQFELGINFAHQLENDHVITNCQQQLFCSTIKQGPLGTILNSSYQQRESIDYKLELGRAIEGICAVVPDGLLVFFPSYPLMDGCLAAWQQTEPGLGDDNSLYQRLGRRKKIFVEPKNKANLPQLLNEYNRCLEGDNGHDKGAVLFAVCRGKISEGLDFSDARCRAVIVTGLPFPPLKEPRVELKRAYLDQRVMNTNRSTTRSGDELLTGEQWYNQSAARAVNQAIGRVIRHRDDYGAILLLDERFAGPRHSAQLSKWLRPHVQVAFSFNEMIIHLEHFFANKRLGMGNKRPSPEPNLASQLDSEELFPVGNQMTRAIEEARAFFTPAESFPREPVIEYNMANSSLPVYIPSSLTSGGTSHISKVFSRIALPMTTAIVGEEGKEKARSFIAKVHTQLLLGPRKKFTAAIKRYKARQITVEQLIYAVFDALEGEGDNLAELRWEFRYFLSVKNHAVFDKIYTSRYGLPSFAPIEPPIPNLSVPLAPITASNVNKPTSLPIPKLNPTESLDNPMMNKVCPSCDTIYADNAYMARCRHVYCFDCWNKQLEEKSHCPNCQQKTRLPQLKKI